MTKSETENSAHNARKATALAYDGKNAPTLVAKGQGELGEQILAIAKAHGVHLHEDAQLVNTLMQLKLNQEIPQNLYIAIARVIAFAYFLQGKRPSDKV